MKTTLPQSNRREPVSAAVFVRWNWRWNTFQTDCPSDYIGPAIILGPHPQVNLRSAEGKKEVIEGKRALTRVKGLRGGDFAKLLKEQSDYRRQAILGLRGNVSSVLEILKADHVWKLNKPVWKLNKKVA